MAAHSEAGHGHITPPSTYIGTWVVLLLLLVATIGVYHLHLGSVGSIAVAMIIAVIKAFLVVFIFMQVGAGTKLIKVWATLGFIWLLILSGIAIDYASRTYRNPDGRPFDPWQTRNQAGITTDATKSGIKPTPISGE